MKSALAQSKVAQTSARASRRCTAVSDGPISTRRKLLSGAAIILGATCDNAPAYAGWDGPAKFLKSRQQANAVKLIAPLEVSLARLKEVSATLQGAEPDYVEALSQVRRASCNCYPFEALASDSIETKASLITSSLKLADPCTFRIVVKNTTLLMDSEDPLRLRAQSSLDSLIRTYSKLDSALLQAGEWDSETQHMVQPLLNEVIEQQIALRDLTLQVIAQGYSV